MHTFCFCASLLVSLRILWCKSAHFWLKVMPPQRCSLVLAWSLPPESPVVPFSALIPPIMASLSFQQMSGPQPMGSTPSTQSFLTKQPGPLPVAQGVQQQVRALTLPGGTGGRDQLHEKGDHPSCTLPAGPVLGHCKPCRSHALEVSASPELLLESFS